MDRIQKLFREPKLRNVAFLICFFAIGQGSLFLAQTYLLVSGHADLLGEFGIAFLCTTLMTQIADWGAQTLLAREGLVKGPAASTVMYWQMSFIRVAVGTVLYALAMIGIQLNPSENTSFLNSYLLMAGLCCFIQAFNIAGLLDASGLSGVTGAVTAAPFLVTGLATPLSVNLSKESAGTFLGAALLLGYVLGGLIQLFFLRRLTMFHRPQGRFLSSQTLSVFGEGFACLLTTLPGQLFYRSQAGAAAILGPEAAGAFLYAKQIISSFSQFSMFAMRAELADFAKAISLSDRIRFSTITNTSSFKLSLFFCGCLSFLSAGLMIFAEGVFEQVAISLLVLSFTLVTNASFSIAVQWAVFKGMATACSIVIAVTTIIGCLGVFGLTYWWGILGPGLGEFILHIGQLFILIGVVKSLSRSTRAALANAPITTS